MQTSRDQKLLITIGIVVVVLLVFGVVILLSLNNPGRSANNATDNSSSTTQTSLSSSSVSSSTPVVVWSQNGNGGWTVMGTAPSCPNPLEIPAPSDLETATALLYPGQTRGGNYKPHGGIAYDNNVSNTVIVSLPMDARLFRGSRYIESGEVQYMLDFVTPCGIMFRLDHLMTLAPEFQALVDAQLPQAQVDESRTTNFQGSLVFAANTVIATEVGHTGNVAFDWGVYDLRQQNQASQNSTYAATHANVSETAFYGMCWIELLPSAEKSIAQGLPARGMEGKTSDYCN